MTTTISRPNLKKILSLLFSFALLFHLVNCSNNKKKAMGNESGVSILDRAGIEIEGLYLGMNVDKAKDKIYDILNIKDDSQIYNIVDNVGNKYIANTDRESIEIWWEKDKITKIVLFKKLVKRLFDMDGKTVGDLVIKLEKKFGIKEFTRASDSYYFERKDDLQINIFDNFQITIKSIVPEENLASTTPAKVIYTEWVERDQSSNKVVMVPSIKLKLNNTSDTIKKNIILRGDFKYSDTNESLGSGSANVLAILRKGDESEEIVLKSNYGYSVTSKEAFVNNIKNVRNVSIRIYIAANKSQYYSYGSMPIINIVEGELYYRGQECLQLEKTGEAIGFLGKALEVNREFAPAWFSLGIAYLKENKFEDSLNSYNRAAEIDPNFIQNWNNRADVLIKLERYQEALNDCYRAIAINGNYALAWATRGEALLALGRNDEAQQSFARAKELGYK